MSVRIAPSILSADFARLGDEVAAVERGGADLLHIDVMDGQFVPNLTIGTPIVQALKRITTIPLDVHLMIVDPDRHIETFAAAGASMISVHVEVASHLHRTLSSIKELGIQAGVAVNPSTPIGALKSVATLLDFVLIMSVNPGFSGQTFIPESTSKLQEARALLDLAKSRASIAVDGGIQPENAAEVTQAGADILVAASAIFGSRDDPATTTRELREAALQGIQTSLRDE